MGGVTARPFGVGIDARDLASMADFWQALTGYDRTADEQRHVFLVNKDRTTAGIYLHRVPEPRPAVKNRLHLELAVQNLPAAEAWVVELGGSIVTRYPDGSPDEPDIRFTVCSDPEGNVFCIGVI